jgi:hypothetical protein
MEMLMKRWTSLLAGLAILAIATLVRLPALTAGLPYTSYIDEGHVLHHAAYLLAHHTWEPDSYAYPTLPFYLVAGAALAWSPVYEHIHGEPLLDDLSPSPPEYYDILEPPDLVVIGRLVTLAFSLGVVLLTGLLVRRLAGPAAGLCAAWFAALVPALVMRSSIANINPIVVFFVLAALLFAEKIRTGDHPRRDAALAGAMAGLAGATKYPAALVCLSVALAIVLAWSPWPEKLRRLLLAGAAAIAALLLAMPALALRTSAVLDSLRTMDNIYGVQVMGSYWEQTIHRAEWDLPVTHPELGLAFVVLAAAALVVASRNRRWSPTLAGWLLFGVTTALLVAPYKFRAFRNVLALVPLACAVVALLYAWARQRFSRPLLTDLAAIVFPVLLFAPGIYDYDTFQLALVDSREEAIHWLRPRLRPNDRLLIQKELAFLPSRLDSLPARTQVRVWDNARDRIIQHKDRYLVMGDLIRPNGKPRIPASIHNWILANYQVAAHFGITGTPEVEGMYRGNVQTIYILRRVPRPDLAAALTAKEGDGDGEDPGGTEDPGER